MRVHFVARNLCAAATSRQFPTQINRDNISGNSEFLADNREFHPQKCSHEILTASGLICKKYWLGEINAVLDREE